MKYKGRTGLVTKLQTTSKYGYFGSMKLDDQN